MKRCTFVGVMWMQIEELQAQVRTQSDADDQVMSYVNAEVEKWKV